MNINRNNYEDFFLLYADGELRADERIAVEDFVAENEDLRMELEMIQATVLPVEEIVFVDKSFLYKAPVFDSVLQEKLLMKIDNELAPAEMASVNEIIASNASATKEYELLQRTKLDASEKIIFEKKHLLYKKERDNVVAFNWLRWAAAAIFIGFGLFVGIKLSNNGTIESTPSVAITTSKPTEKKNDIIADTGIKNNIENIATNTNDTKNNIANENNESGDKGKELNEAINKTNNAVAVQKNNIAKKDISIKNAIPSKTIIEEPKKEEQTQVANNNNKYLPDTKLAPLEKTMPVKNEPIIIAAVNPPTDARQPILKDESIVPLENTYNQAVAVNNVEKNENQILYMNEDAVKRSKTGGFFRKLKRFVQRTANIKPGNTLQIAGFEIAAR
jgi:hypothetical protein